MNETEPTVDPTTHTDTDGGGEMDGGSVLTAEVEAPTVDAQPDTTEPAAPQFQLPEQYAEDPRFEGVDSVEKLFEKIDGMGAPESVDAYTASLTGVNDDGMTGLKTAALEAKLTPGQFEKVVGFYNQQTEVAQKAQQDMVNKWVDDVRTEWGDSFDTNLKTAKTALAALAPRVKGLKERLEHPAYGSDPVWLETFRAIGEMISEDVIRTGDAPAGTKKDPVQGGVKYFSTYDKTMEK